MKPKTKMIIYAIIYGSIHGIIAFCTGVHLYLYYTNSVPKTILAFMIILQIMVVIQTYLRGRLGRLANGESDKK